MTISMMYGTAVQIFKSVDLPDVQDGRCPGQGCSASGCKGGGGMEKWKMKDKG